MAKNINKAEAKAGKAGKAGEDRFWTGKLREKVRAYALQNAVKFKGRANAGAVVGRLMGEHAELRERKSDVLDIVNRIVEEVSRLSPEDQIKELKMHPELHEEKPKEEKKKELPELRDAGKPVVMRFAPSPSGPLHIGHAYVLGLNAEFTKKNRGKFLLRIEDTNPANIDPDAYQMIPENANWLTGNAVAEVIVQSDRMDLYMEKALEMIDRGVVYVCTCSGDEFREISKKREECPCRNKAVEKNLRDWHRMGAEFREGEAVLRFKTDMKHKNPAMRDFPLFRIAEEEHPRVGRKYRLWPLMNFSVAVDDYDLGVTHILRAKDHVDNAARQEYIQRAMGWDVPQAFFVGRINFTEMDLSTSETRQAILQGKFSGWDDVRLPFLAALRRRGYQPEAFIKYALDVGVTLNDKKVSNRDFFKAIDAFNTAIIEPTAHRHFFVEDPVKITVTGAPELDIELDLHPDNRKGGRKFHTGSSFIIAKEDFSSLSDGTLNRLMDCLNFVKNGRTFAFDSQEYGNYKDHGKRIIHWLPDDSRAGNVEVKVLMPDGSAKEGLGESGLNSLKAGAIIQLERFGFCRLDSKEGGKLVFCYGHR